MEVSFLLFGWLALLLLVQGQDQPQSGFISIDCGINEGSNYTDKTTGIHYISDAGLIDSGVIKAISPEFKTDLFPQQFWNVRSFPDRTKNCYTLRPQGGAKGKQYLIRGWFMYGNYDDKNKFPQFNLYIGVDFWTTAMLDDSMGNYPQLWEIIHVLSSDYIHVCLVNTGEGTPFISALELRPLNNLSYATINVSLYSRLRLDLGSTLRTNEMVRYKDDVYDRMWNTIMPPEWDYNYLTLSSNSSQIIDSQDDPFRPPSKVMRTAFTPNASSDYLSLWWPANLPTEQYYIYLYFAELEELQANQSREFNIYMNGNLWNEKSIVPNYLSTTTICITSPAGTSNSPKFELLIKKTSTSTLPPSINAIEVYSGVKQLHLYSQTDDRDVAAILSIKLMYGVTRNWQGDPCGPKHYEWVGLSCNDDSKSPRIISLTLSSSELTGKIAPSISNLTMIQSLDLSNNNLTGQVPSFLSRLPFLKVLNLKGNNFTSSIPAELLVRSKNGSLSLSIEGIEGENTNSCQSIPCKKKKSKVVPVVASVAALLSLLLTAVMAALWESKRRKRVKKENTTNQMEGKVEENNRQLSYSEVLSITNNFERVVGKGGFGTVYHGYFSGIQVAVKMLSSSSVQGRKEFQAEANILMRVRHKNLTSLVGCCNEGTNMGIIYEYMANGNLKSHLSDRNSTVLTWKERLQIALDAAQGLEYLHHGCKPPIIHRDVKTTNILLNEKFQAKLSDFGLSRIFPTESGSHVTATIAGTHGYLDPEYCTSHRLTEKSDVYSFGVVLLEIITNRPIIVKQDHSNPYIIEWVSFMLANGDVRSIIDPRLQQDFDVNTVWKAVELAMACVSRNTTRRPTMYNVVMELRECLATEIARQEMEPNESIGVMSMQHLDSDMSLPEAR